MLTAILDSKTYVGVEQCLCNIPPEVDAVEWRLDYLSHYDLVKIAAVRRKIALPLILTLRTMNQGGLYEGSVEQYQRCVLELLEQCQPDYIDIEYTLPTEFFAEINNAFPAVKIINSYHDFSKTSDDLSKLFDTIYNKSAHITKLITFANSSLDSLRMFQFVKAAQAKHNIIGHCMGENGEFSREIGRAHV